MVPMAVRPLIIVTLLLLTALQVRAQGPVTISSDATSTGESSVTVTAPGEAPTMVVANYSATVSYTAFVTMTSESTFVVTGTIDEGVFTGEGNRLEATGAFSGAGSFTPPDLPTAEEILMDPDVVNRPVTGTFTVQGDFLASGQDPASTISGTYDGGGPYSIIPSSGALGTSASGTFDAEFRIPPEADAATCIAGTFTASPTAAGLSVTDLRAAQLGASIAEIIVVSFAPAAVSAPIATAAAAMPVPFMSILEPGFNLWAGPPPTLRSPRLSPRSATGSMPSSDGRPRGSGSPSTARARSPSLTRWISWSPVRATGC